MRKLLLSVLSALLVTAVNGIEHSAQATVWKNYKDESQCLGVSAGDMTPGTQVILWDCNGNPDQNWNFSPYVNGVVWAGHQFEQMWTSGSSAPTGLPTDVSSRCAALPNGNTNPDQPIIIWNCQTATNDQGWAAVYVLTDPNGASCYWIWNQKQSGDGYTLSLYHGDHFGVSHNVVMELLDTNKPLRSDQLWCAY